MIRTMIRGTGRFVPPRVVTNDELSELMDTTDEWIQQRSGIQQRHWIPEEGGIGTSDLALEASKIAMERAGWTSDDVDLIIFATLSPDYFFPGPGCLLQHKLGMDTTPALDIRQQCSGFIYGMATADAYIKTGMAKRILLVGAEVQSTGIDITTRGREVAVLFGDGAAAVCLEGTETDQNIGILDTVLHAKGQFAESLMTEVPTSNHPGRITEQMLREGRHFPTMDGKGVFKQAVRRLPEATHEVLAKAGLSLEDVDLIIPHQANMRINQFYQRTLGVPEEKVFHNIMNYGNTTAASIPLALDDAIEQGRINPAEDTVLFVGLGAGLTWGAVLYRFA